MSRHTWRWDLWRRSTDPERLRKFVMKHLWDAFDDHDRKVLSLINSWNWPRVAHGVRAECCQMRQERYDPSADCFNPQARLYHPIRRILGPAYILTGIAAKRNARITL